MMPMPRKLTWLGLVLAVSWPNAGADESRLPPQELARRAAAIRPTASELRWQQVPWLGSLVEARTAARAEKRPLLVWTLDENPWERC